MILFNFRASQIDFKFAVKWTGDYFEQLWFVIGLLAFIKYFIVLYLSTFSLKTMIPLVSALKITQLIMIFSGIFLLFMLIFQRNNPPLLLDSVAETMSLILLVISLQLITKINSVFLN
jgi:hypothetical protein